MDLLAPHRPVYQAWHAERKSRSDGGGIAALEELAATDAYEKLEQTRGTNLEREMVAAAKSASVPVQFNRCGSMFALISRLNPCTTWPMR